MGPGPGARGPAAGGGRGDGGGQPAPGPGPGAHVRLDPRRLLSGTSTPVAMHFSQERYGILIYNK